MNAQKESCRRLCLTVRGAVQGVGFRPFVFRLATEHDLAGWIQNSPAGVRIELEGNSERLGSFLEQFERDAPALGRIQSLTRTRLDPPGYTTFHILKNS